MQDAQKVRPARPQQAQKRRVPLRYVELLRAARTPLADFLSIRLEPTLARVWPALPGAESRGKTV
jgi:hypothetical protein